MIQYQKALNNLYNLSSDENAVKESYQILNRLIKKESVMKPLIRYNEGDHRILCPTCKIELDNQNQHYCMNWGQKLIINRY